MVKKTISFIWCFFACQLLYMFFSQTVPSIYWISWIAFYLLMFAGINKILTGEEISARKLFLLTLIACFFSEIGILINHISMNKWLLSIYYLLVSFSYSMFLFWDKFDFFKTKKTIKIFWSKDFFVLLVIFLLSLYLMEMANTVYQVRRGFLVAARENPLYYLGSIFSGPIESPDFMLPQFAFFTWSSSTLCRK